MKSHSNMDKYDIDGEIGSGGYGKVYSAISRKAQEAVAIKIFVPQLYDDNTPLEVTMLRKCQHVRGVVKIIDSMKVDKTYYALVMSKPRKCMDLFDYITKHGALPEEKARRFFRTIMNTVSEMFDAGIVHRDIKDENFIVNLDTEELTLVDFGAATFVKSDSYTDFFGTKIWYPPEYIHENVYYAESSTIWSCGVMLYDLAFGNIPFDTVNDITQADIKCPADCSKELKDLICKMLTADHTKRISIKQVLNHAFMNM